MLQAKEVNRKNKRKQHERVDEEAEMQLRKFQGCSDTETPPLATPQGPR